MKIKTITAICMMVLFTTIPAQAVTISDDEAYQLAKIAMAEAESQSTEGKALVINVVLNRVKSAEFPNTVYGVLHEKDQFTPVTVDGRYYKVEPNSDCWKAVEMVRNGWDESRGALYFCEGHSSWHEKHLTFLFQNGAHKFYR